MARVPRGMMIKKSARTIAPRTDDSIQKETVSPSQADVAVQTDDSLPLAHSAASDVLHLETLENFERYDIVTNDEEAGKKVGGEALPAEVSVRAPRSATENAEAPSDTLATNVRPNFETVGIGNGRDESDIGTQTRMPSEEPTFRRPDTDPLAGDLPNLAESFAGGDGLSFRYCVDEITDDKVVGWITVQDDPLRRCVVALKEGGHTCARAVASGFRPDLRSADIGDGCYAFLLQMPRSALDGEEHLLEIVEEESGFALTKSPIRWRSTVGTPGASLTRIGNGMMSIGAESGRSPMTPRAGYDAIRKLARPLRLGGRGRMALSARKPASSSTSLI
jgi:hypothetical protein